MFIEIKSGEDLYTVNTDQIAYIQKFPLDTTIVFNTGTKLVLQASYDEVTGQINHAISSAKVMDRMINRTKS